MIQNTNYGASKTYVNTKVDKLTTSGLKAYTHDGATQGEIDVSNIYTPATLALRDANGRLQAADPASGATDKTLVTANWVSQTGTGRPNNLIHDGGDEIIRGGKTFINRSTINASGIYPIPIVFKMTSEDATDLSTFNGMGIQINDGNDAALFRILLFKNRKTKSLVIRFYDSAGVGHDITVASYTEP